MRKSQIVLHEADDEYWDNGSMLCTCKLCLVLHFLDERLIYSGSIPSNPNIGTCCSNDQFIRHFLLPQNFPLCKKTFQADEGPHRPSKLAEKC